VTLNIYVFYVSIFHNLIETDRSQSINTPLRKESTYFVTQNAS